MTKNEEKIKTIKAHIATYEGKIKTASNAKMVGLGFSDKESYEAMLTRLRNKLNQLNSK